MLPLDDIRVVDFSWSLPGPYATMLLADMGADVLRIEQPEDREIFRRLEPMDGASSHAHRYVNRNKSAAAFDLKSSAQQAQLLSILDQADVLVEQFRPGVMKRLGLDYQTLHARNPRLVYCSISGYGQSGAYAHRAGHDINYMALSGVAYCMGSTSAQPAGPFALPVADLAGGSLHAVIGIMTALRHRDRSGKGQHVDVSMTDAVQSLNAFLGPGALNGCDEPAPGGSLLNGASFYGHYETADGRYMAVGGLEPKFREGLCLALGREEMTEAALSSDDAQQEHFRQFLQQTFLQRTFDEWQRFFRDRDLCVEPVLTVSEAAAHDRAVTRDATVEIASRNGNRRQFAHPLRYSAIQPRYEHAGEDAAGGGVSR